jgi:hypothetical protein
MSPMKKNAAQVAGTVMLFIGLATSVIGYFELQTHQQYAAEGVRVEAVITGKQKEHDAEDGWSYWFEYSFVTEAEKTVEGWEYVGEEEFNTVEPGTPVQIVYLASAPEVNTYANYLATEAHIYMLAFGGVFLVAGLGLFLLARFR